MQNDLPDSAMVCLPPTATEVIFTPWPMVTREGDTIKKSSPEAWLSDSCLANETFLRFPASSPTFLLSGWESDPLLVFGLCGLSV